MTSRRVVVGVDGSTVAVQALDRAAEEAVLCGTALEMVCAVTDLDEAGPVLASSLSRVRHRHPELAVISTPVEGDPAQALVRRGGDAVLTVVGSRGLGGLAGLLVGSVSSQVAARTRSPLLVVRGHRAAQRHGQKGGEVLLGMEGDADAEAAAYAFEEAERRGSRLHVLHAWTTWHPAAIGAARPTADLPDDPARPGQAVPGQVLAELQEKHPRVQVHTQSVHAGPVQALVEATVDADTVVIAAHRRPGIRNPVHLGPVSHALLRHSHCPVALVPTADGDGQDATWSAWSRREGSSGRTE